MSLVILLLSSLWEAEGLRTTTRSTGLVNWDVTKLPNFFPFKPTNSRPGNIWELLNSATDLITLPSTNGTTSMEVMTKEFLPYWNSGQMPISANLNVALRLRKLDYYFSSLRISEEDCRLRLLCELAKDPAKFSPLAISFLDETRFIGDEKSLALLLLKSVPGTKLLRYIEATLRGSHRKTCEAYVYRCPKSTEGMIHYQTLLLWREISKWLTVKIVSRGPSS